MTKMLLCTNGITILIVCSNDMAGQMSRGDNAGEENVSGTKVSAPKRVNKSAENKDFFSFFSSVESFLRFPLLSSHFWDGSYKTFYCRNLRMFVKKLECLSLANICSW